MNILFLSALVPYPPEDGDRQRSFHLLQALAAHHQVHLVCFYSSWAEYRQLEALQAFCASVEGVRISRWAIRRHSLLAWPSATPLNVAAFCSPAMQKAVARAVRKYGIEAVHAYRLRMAPYALAVKHVKKVLDYTDALTRYFQARTQQPAPFWKKIYLKREARTLAAYEPKVSRQFDAAFISSPGDQALLQQLGSGNIQVASNGVDARQLRPQRTLPSAKTVLFVGNMQYPPNAEGLRDFCVRSWPRVAAAVPGATLQVVGLFPVGSESHWGRIYPGAEFVGRVPAVEPYYAQARVVICPLQVAAGRQFKAIEAFAAGVPVVATSVVAENLGAVSEREVMVGDTPEVFADQIVRLLQNTPLADRLRKNARRLAEKQYDWSEALSPVLATYAQWEKDGKKIRKRKVPQ
ncbi:MAG: glycosyltransferase [Candidatus Firestonebacteria bacterium]|nr:glycosyltransferase [Candidatus Firestonebacteria bacterium]